MRGNDGNWREADRKLTGSSAKVDVDCRGMMENDLKLRENRRNDGRRWEIPNFKEHVETYSGLLARVIQHEYDHIEGVLFTDKLSSLRKRMIKGRLANISKGKISVEYRMKFPSLKKGR